MDFEGYAKLNRIYRHPTGVYQTYHRQCLQGLYLYNHRVQDLKSEDCTAQADFRLWNTCDRAQYMQTAQHSQIVPQQPYDSIPGNFLL
jgi:hypothetical protein